MLNGVVTGRLGKNATVTQVGSNKVVTFNVATDVGLGDREHTVWVRCSDWRPWAEKLAPYLTKGKEVTVFGQLDLREYDSSGGKRTSLELRVTEVDLHGGTGQSKEDVPF